jgi:hypothetical protein
LNFCESHNEKLKIECELYKQNEMKTTRSYEDELNSNKKYQIEIDSLKAESHNLKKSLELANLKQSNTENLVEQFKIEVYHTKNFL